MSDIRFDFDVAKKQEEALKDIEHRFEQMIAGKYDSCMTELGQTWHGDEGKLFQNKMMLQREKLKHTAMLIAHAKHALHEAGVKIHYAEENAKEIAEIRTYK